LARQIDSALYQRLALSANKDKIKAQSEKGQIIESASDAKLQGEFSSRNLVP
jgi:predicted nuclease of restriction endonuclease-like (RecB) superfamily